MVAHYLSLWRHVWQPESNLLDPGLSLGVPEDELPDVMRGSGLWHLMRGDYQVLTEFPQLGPVRLSKASTKQMLNAIAARSPDGGTWRGKRRVLEVLDAGNHRKLWSVGIPYLPAPLPASLRSYAVDRDFALYLRYQDIWATLLPLVLTNAAQGNSARWGRVLCCLVLGSGLLTSRWLPGVPEALRAAPDHLQWLDLVMPGKAKSQVRRLYLDPLTRYVLADIGRSAWPHWPHRKLIVQKAMRCIHAYRDQVAPGIALPGNWSDLRAIARMHLALYAPGYLVGYAIGDYESASIRPEAFGQLVDPPREISIEKPTHLGETESSIGAGVDDDVEATSPLAAVKDEQHEQSAEIGTGCETDTDTEDWAGPVRDLGSIIRKGEQGGAQRVEAWRRDYQQGCDGSGWPCMASLDRLAEWIAQDCYAGGKGRRKPMKMRTVAEYYRLLAMRLVGQLGHIDPVALDGIGAYAELYMLLIEDVDKASERVRLLGALRSFHEWLSRAYDAPAFSELGLPKAGQGAATVVDACAFTPDLFERAMDLLLHEHAGAGNDAEVAVMISRLGYYSGLRRSEAAGLRLADVKCAIGRTEIFLAANNLRGLKSSSAERLIRLDGLWPEAALKALRDWAEHQKSGRGECGETMANALLFPPRAIGRGDSDQKMALYERLFTWIAEALRAASGISSARYHHLRHSFANRMLIAMWRCDRPTDTDPTGWLDRWVTAADAVAMHDAAIGYDTPQRRGLWAIGKLLGHCSPEITLRHYVHSCDLILGRATRQMLAPLPNKTLASLRKRAPEVVHHGECYQADYLDALADHRLGEARCLRVRSAGERPRIAMPHDPFKRLLLMTRMLNRRHDPAAYSGPEFQGPWPDETLDRMLAWLAAMPEGLRKAYRGSFDGLFDPPQTQQGHNLGRQVATLLFSKGCRPRDRRAFTDFFLRARLGGGSLNLWIERLPDAKRWVELLQQLSLLDTFDWYHATARSQGSKNGAAQRRYWAEHLGLAVRDERPAFGTERMPARAARGALVGNRASGPETQRRRWVYGVCWAITATFLYEVVNNPRASSPQDSDLPRCWAGTAGLDAPNEDRL
ncbi:tyrosine-type recombinase/integrase [Algiphilus sp. NNCM1]|uniref:tyrosine-type recombinase/integrase n=1 Tax=Algiphilus sp. TaxID=1872431 RepID=UPI001CA7368B|nr:tyrosine-type recombinase/integrase [Algiphilus sp.]MBY8965014.1 tyrosine-type recombinase/integrase [Algiphilus acroporae]MCI5104170.1 tyrosine-type recombinase/integrase [Algiphilus sp.]